MMVKMLVNLTSDQINTIMCDIFEPYSLYNYLPRISLINTGNMIEINYISSNKIYVANELNIENIGQRLTIVLQLIHDCSQKELEISFEFQSKTINLFIFDQEDDDNIVEFNTIEQLDDYLSKLCLDDLSTKVYMWVI
jgi:uncharacterized protein with NRDE domain